MSKYLDILHEVFGYESFRGIQEDIIESIGQGRDTLGLMPTGGGKSLCFQVPTLAQEGLCLVVTPLIALMKDQVRSLRQRGIKAEMVHAGMMHDDIVRVRSISFSMSRPSDWRATSSSPNFPTCATSA